MKNRGNIYFFYPRSRFYKLCSGLMIIKVMCLNKNKEFPEHKGKPRCMQLFEANSICIIKAK